MSVYSLEIFSYKGAKRIAIETLLAFVLFTIVYMILIEPILHMSLPNVYTTTELNYSRTALPNTPNEITHLVLMTTFVGSFFYYRLYHTKLGRDLIDAYEENYQIDYSRE